MVGANKEAGVNKHSSKTTEAKPAKPKKSGSLSGRTSPGLNVKRFTIPKKQKDLLNEVELDSSEYLREVLPIIQQGYRDSNSKNKFSYVKAQLVHNATIKREFMEKKREMKDEGRNEKELTESFAFLFVDKEEKVKELCRDSLSVRYRDKSGIHCLGKPTMGVHLCRYSDILQRSGVCKNGMLLIFKILKGKVKAIPLAYGRDLLEPTPNFDCHVAKNSGEEQPGAAVIRLFDSSQIFIYDFDTDEVEFRPRPRNVCPFAVVHFTYSDGGSASSATTTASFNRKMPSTSSDSTPARSVSVPETMSQAVVAPCFPRDDIMRERPKGDKDKPFLMKYAEYSERTYRLWAGSLINKNGSSCRVAVVSFSLAFLPCKMPENLASLKAVRSKDLSLPTRVFTGAIPMLSRKKEDQANGKYYLYAELQSLDEDDAVYTRFLNYLMSKHLVLKKPLKENLMLYILPTGDMTSNLGLTSTSYPKMLHCLFESCVPMVHHLTDVSVRQAKHKQKINLESAPIHDIDKDHVKRARFQASLARLFTEQNRELKEMGVRGDEEMQMSDLPTPLNHDRQEDMNITSAVTEERVLDHQHNIHSQVGYGAKGQSGVESKDQQVSNRPVEQHPNGHNSDHHRGNSSRTDHQPINHSQPSEPHPNNNHIGHKDKHQSHTLRPDHCPDHVRSNSWTDGFSGSQHVTSRSDDQQADRQRDGKGLDQQPIPRPPNERRSSHQPVGNVQGNNRSLERQHSYPKAKAPHHASKDSRHHTQQLSQNTDRSQAPRQELPAQIKEVASKVHKMLTGGIDLGLLGPIGGSGSGQVSRPETEDEKLARMRATLQSLVAERERLAKQNTGKERMKSHAPVPNADMQSKTTPRVPIHLSGGHQQENFSVRVAEKTVRRESDRGGDRGGFHRVSDAVTNGMTVRRREEEENVFRDGHPSMKRKADNPIRRGHKKMRNDTPRFSDTKKMQQDTSGASKMRSILQGEMGSSSIEMRLFLENADRLASHPPKWIQSSSEMRQFLSQQISRQIQETKSQESSSTGIWEGEDGAPFSTLSGRDQQRVNLYVLLGEREEELTGGSTRDFPSSHHRVTWTKKTGAVVEVARNKAGSKLRVPPPGRSSKRKEEKEEMIVSCTSAVLHGAHRPPSTVQPDTKTKEGLAYQIRQVIHQVNQPRRSNPRKVMDHRLVKEIKKEGDLLNQSSSSLSSSQSSTSSTGVPGVMRSPAQPIPDEIKKGNRKKKVVKKQSINQGHCNHTSSFKHPTRPCKGAALRKSKQNASRVNKKSPKSKVKQRLSKKSKAGQREGIIQAPAAQPYVLHADVVPTPSSMEAEKGKDSTMMPGMSNKQSSASRSTNNLANDQTKEENKCSASQFDQSGSPDGTVCQNARQTANSDVDPVSAEGNIKQEIRANTKSIGSTEDHQQSIDEIRQRVGKLDEEKMPCNGDHGERAISGSPPDVISSIPCQKVDNRTASGAPDVVAAPKSSSLPADEAVSGDGQGSVNETNCFQPIQGQEIQPGFAEILNSVQELLQPLSSEEMTQVLDAFDQLLSQDGDDTECLLAPQGDEGKHEDAKKVLQEQPVSDSSEVTRDAEMSKCGVEQQNEDSQSSFDNDMLGLKAAENREEIFCKNNTENVEVSVMQVDVVEVDNQSSTENNEMSAMLVGDDVVEVDNQSSTENDEVPAMQVDDDVVEVISLTSSSTEIYSIGDIPGENEENNVDVLSAYASSGFDSDLPDYGRQEDSNKKNETKNAGHDIEKSNELGDRLTSIIDLDETVSAEKVGSIPAAADVTTEESRETKSVPSFREAASEGGIKASVQQEAVIEITSVRAPLPGNLDKRTKSSVFERLGAKEGVTVPQVSAFDRLNKTLVMKKVSVFDRLHYPDNNQMKKVSVFDRLASKKSPESTFLKELESQPCPKRDETKGRAVKSKKTGQNVTCRVVQKVKSSTYYPTSESRESKSVSSDKSKARKSPVRIVQGPVIKTTSRQKELVRDHQPNDKRVDKKSKSKQDKIGDKQSGPDEKHGKVLGNKTNSKGNHRDKVAKYQSDEDRHKKRTVLTKEESDKIRSDILKKVKGSYRSSVEVSNTSSRRNVVKKKAELPDFRAKESASSKYRSSKPRESCSKTGKGLRDISGDLDRKQRSDRSRRSPLKSRSSSRSRSNSRSGSSSRSRSNTPCDDRADNVRSFGRSTRVSSKGEHSKKRIGSNDNRIDSYGKQKSERSNRSPSKSQSVSSSRSKMSCISGAGDVGVGNMFNDRRYSPSKATEPQLKKWEVSHHGKDSVVVKKALDRGRSSPLKSQSDPGSGDNPPGNFVAGMVDLHDGFPGNISLSAVLKMTQETKLAFKRAATVTQPSQESENKSSYTLAKETQDDLSVGMVKRGSEVKTNRGNIGNEIGTPEPIVESAEQQDRDCNPKGNIPSVGKDAGSAPSNQHLAVTPLVPGQRERISLKAPSSVQPLNGNRYHPYDRRQKKFQGHYRSLSCPGISHLKDNLSEEAYRIRQMPHLCSSRRESFFDRPRLSPARFKSAPKVNHDAKSVKNAEEVETVHSSKERESEITERKPQVQALDRQIESMLACDSDIQDFFMLDVDVYPVKDLDDREMSSHVSYVGGMRAPPRQVVRRPPDDLYRHPQYRPSPAGDRLPPQRGWVAPSWSQRWPGRSATWTRSYPSPPRGGFLRR
ncbi:uncharacterized protein [Diadema antillarum]|uniref:uncharacterized protein n=1 Tax=Diadema antillarum TaxID=105358 RepID=UPI003A8C6B5F